MTPTDRFDGKTFVEELDGERLGRQLSQVRALCLDGVWRTLREISLALEAPEASVSARLRDLRKPRFGEHEVMRRRRGDPRSGLHEYRVLVRGGTP